VMVTEIGRVVGKAARRCEAPGWRHF
jgi:hypothetical protein